jgi:hypothetical protein
MHVHSLNRAGADSVSAGGPAWKTIPSGVGDGELIQLDGADSVVVHVAPQPRDSTFLRGAAAAGLVLALAFLALLLFG